MPLYDYECSECGQRTEVLTKTPPPKTCECRLCGAIMERQISVPAPPKFNGSGFYETDFKNKG